MINLGKGADLNLEKLIATRMLINANSGGGKSYAIRRFLEQSHGKVQQIVIDLEGEFSTLREKYDYLLIGKDGEAPASIRTAELLARKLLELNVSTIIDLSELKHAERITFVKRFLDSLINSPQDLWHPAIIIVDEAHQFCPEGAKSESASAVIDLATRGRKRGFCAVLATQRISKLSKDAAAECNNYMIGRTGLDIDMKRAGELLGFTSKDDIRALRDLKAGEFFTFGPAFNHTGIKEIMIGEVETTHPDRTRGIEIKKVVETPANIKKLLKNVIDLPKEAELELRTTQDFKKTIQELRTKLTLAERNVNKEKIVNVIDNKAIERAYQDGAKHVRNEMMKEILYLRKENDSLIGLMGKIGSLLKIKPGPRMQYPQKYKSNDNPIAKMPDISDITPLYTEFKGIRNAPQEVREFSHLGEDKLPPAFNRMLKVIASYYPNKVSKQRLAILSEVSSKSSTLSVGISKMKEFGLIETNNNEVYCTNKGLERAGDVEMVEKDPAYLLNMWSNKLPPAFVRMLNCLYEAYPNKIEKNQLSQLSNVSRNSSTFSVGLSKLNGLGLINLERDEVSIKEEFFQ